MQSSEKSVNPQNFFIGWSESCNFALNMRVAYWISKRLRIGRGTPASTSTGVVIAIAGVALALVVMELSLAITTGFKHEIRRKIAGFDAVVSVLPPTDYATAVDEPLLHASDTLMRVVREAAPGARLSLTLARKAIVKTDSDFNAVECVARDGNHDDSFERGNMVAGSWPAFALEESRDSIVMSQPLADRLGLGVGDRTFLYFFTDGEVKARRVYLAGLYRSNFAEYDDNVVYASLPLLQRLSGADSLTASSISVEGIAIDDARAVSARLSESLVNAMAAGALTRVYRTSDITQTGALYLNWLDLLDTNVVVIFILMLCVAAFTLISSLFIIILDRVTTIGILRSIGASRSLVSGIFVNIAMKLVGTGLLIGNILGIGLILIQSATHAVPLDPQMYYLSYVPVEINWLWLLLLNVGVGCGAWLILILPARLAARIDPASAMRYE